MDNRTPGPDERKSPGLWIDKEVQEDNTLTYFERMVLAEIIYFHRYGDTGCHPSNGHFATKYKVSKANISTLFRELERKGRIKRKTVWEHGRCTGRIITPIIGGVVKIVTVVKNVTPRLLKSYPNKEKNKDDVIGGKKADDANKFSSTIPTERSVFVGITPAAFERYWNSKPNLPPILDFGEHRRSKLKNRTGESIFASRWVEIIDRLADTPFCCGAGPKGWKANIDWLLKNSSNYIGLLEGKYDNHEKAPDEPVSAPDPVYDATIERIEREKALKLKALEDANNCNT